MKQTFSAIGGFSTGLPDFKAQEGGCEHLGNFYDVVLGFADHVGDQPVRQISKNLAQGSLAEDKRAQAQIVEIRRATDTVQKRRPARKRSAKSAKIDEMIRPANLTHELQSHGWTLDEAIRRVANSINGRPEIASLLASGKLIAYTYCETGGLTKMSSSDFACGWPEDERRFSKIHVFPILHSPDVCALISGSSLRDAFQKYVLDDPEVRQLSIRAIQVDPDTERVLEGSWQPRGAAEWPVNDGILDENDPYEWSESKLARLMSRGTPDEVRKFRHVLRLRFGTLLKLLQSGKLHARGDPVRRGDNQEILPSIWSHHDFLLDAKAGDLVQWNDGSDPIYRSRARLVRWRAIYLASAKVDSGISGGVSDRFMGASAVATTPRPVAPVSKTTSRDACKKWLIEEMRRSPNQRPAPKEAYRKQALDRWRGTLSSRTFDRVWAEAIIQAPAERWSSPGRPIKSSQA
ncbi:hypothetical protein U7859_02185 [Bradyrhizobium ottawaense]|uniref:hypothetical protein n=1 Tax=Bradyrhizobium ottawaense TaxID=931866 RepID=UPI001BA769CA|nr:hypothetical protein [Bradyrhizobium ottawaense]MBR1335334.1 hypothetical protein [Bradyrhizobium ottawaense]WQN83312.1 hypothetical protein U7859_02185 [Bradyrhizobium ottawaense]